MQEDLMPEHIFSPGSLAINLADGLVDLGIDVTLFSPGKVTTKAKNIVGDLSLFDYELSLRGYGYSELLKKHPLLFSTLARQIQNELIFKAYKMANANEFDLVHVYMNEEEIALVMSDLCNKPVVFSHHEPYNFLAKYRSIFPKYEHKNWISISYSQRKTMPERTNWVGNVYHGFPARENRITNFPDISGQITNEQEDGGKHEHFGITRSKPSPLGEGGPLAVGETSHYLAYFGRIIEPKGVHLAIAAVKQYNKLRTRNSKLLTLKIAGKHYGDMSNDLYWEEKILPEVDGKEIQYIGFINKDEEKQQFLANAKALIIPSIWEEPFGMVMIEALSCGTPLIGLNPGAIPEIIKNGETGFVEEKINKEKLVINNAKTSTLDERKTVDQLSKAIGKIDRIDRKKCLEDFEKRFTVQRMCEEYLEIYEKVIRR